mmetsp:Transcript_81376/g.230983  ORF Transcript_81376/g.230983 Transcript_81376/m.230983 type:complete len:202 (-) Transcript_81376:891-1496(-)
MRGLTNLCKRSSSSIHSAKSSVPLPSVSSIKYSNFWATLVRLDSITLALFFACLSSTAIRFDTSSACMRSRSLSLTSAAPSSRAMSSRLILILTRLTSRSLAGRLALISWSSVSRTFLIFSRALISFACCRTCFSHPAALSSVWFDRRLVSATSALSSSNICLSSCMSIFASLSSSWYLIICSLSSLLRRCKITFSPRVSL